MVWKYIGAAGNCLIPLWVVIRGRAYTRSHYLHDQHIVTDENEKTEALSSGAKEPLNSVGPYLINAIFFTVLNSPLRARRKYMPLACLRPVLSLPFQIQVCHPGVAGPSCKVRTLRPRKS